MLKYVSIIAPLLMRSGAPNPVRVMTGYMGAFLLAVVAAIFLLAALFTSIATNYGLDVAFLVIALILIVGAIILAIMARVSKIKGIKASADRQERIAAMLASRDDPLADHIPEELLTHPLSQKILAQVEDKPFMAGATAIGLGIMISRQLFDASE